MPPQSIFVSLRLKPQETQLDVVRIKRTIAEVYTYRTAVAGTLPHQFQPISPPIHPRCTSFQPLEVQFSVASQ
jgi:hypothetical protein